MSLLVKLDELVPAKEAARTLPRVLERLEDPTVEQLVITTRNKPTAILVSVDRYEALVSAASNANASGAARGSHSTCQ